jgi:two-component system, response regulator PdtaR
MKESPRKARVLLVEDEALAALEIRESLEELGHTVTDVMESGDAVLQSALKDPPDVIVMDIHLKSFTDGIDVASRLEMLKRIPVIFITGYVDAEIRERAMRLSPAAYLVKPIEMSVLAREVEKALQKAG